MTAVTGTYRDAQGDPASGYIRFTLKPPALTVDGEQVVCSPVYAILDPAGHLAVDLIPDSELVVDGVAVYEVAEYLDGCHRTWHLALVDDQPVDLPSRYPGDPAGDVAVLPVPGPQGPQGERGPQGVPGQDGSDGLSAEWGTASTWAALPPTGNWPGRRVRVLDGLGLCLAVWDGAGWRVDEQSYTGRMNPTPRPEFQLGVGGGTVTAFWVARRGGTVALHLRTSGVHDFPGSPNRLQMWDVPSGWLPGVYSTYGSALQGINAVHFNTTGQMSRLDLFSIGAWTTAPLTGSTSWPTTDPWPTTPPA